MVDVQETRIGGNHQAQRILSIGRLASLRRWWNPWNRLPWQEDQMGTKSSSSEDSRNWTLGFLAKMTKRSEFDELNPRERGEQLFVLLLKNLQLSFSSFHCHKTCISWNLTHKERQEDILNVGAIRPRKCPSCCDEKYTHDSHQKLKLIFTISAEGEWYLVQYSAEGFKVNLKFSKSSNSVNLFLSYMCNVHQPIWQGQTGFTSREHDVTWLKEPNEARTQNFDCRLHGRIQDSQKKITKQADCLG